MKEAEWTKADGQPASPDLPVRIFGDSGCFRHSTFVILISIGINLAANFRRAL